jgi:hypothetical protein
MDFIEYQQSVPSHTILTTLTFVRTRPYPAYKNLAVNAGQRLTPSVLSLVIVYRNAHCLTRGSIRPFGNNYGTHRLVAGIAGRFEVQSVSGCCRLLC